MDSVRHRLTLLRLAWRTRSWAGIGPGVTPLLHRRAYCAGDLPVATGTVHCEPAQLVSEYGVAGALAGLFFLHRVGTGLELGDPWSAMMVSGAVLGCGSMALRAAPLGVMWLLACAHVVAR